MPGRRLAVISGRCAVVRLAASAPLPEWVHRAAWSSVTRTPDELSIICDERVVPIELRPQQGWAAVRVCGTLAFTEVGVLADLLRPLAEAGIPILAVSTHDTDYVLVPAEQLADAVRALTGAGHPVEPAEGDRVAR